MNVSRICKYFQVQSETEVKWRRRADKCTMKSITYLDLIKSGTQRLFDFRPVVNSCDQRVGWTLLSLAPRIVPVQIEQKNLDPMFGTLQSVPWVVVNENFYSKRPNYQLSHNRTLRTSILSFSHYAKIQKVRCKCVLLILMNEEFNNKTFTIC